MTPKIQWPLVLFSLLAGAGGCAFAFAGAANALGEGVGATGVVAAASLALIAVGGICSVLHLARPQHAFAAVTHLLSFSGISVELIMLGVTGVLMVAYLALCWFGGSEAARLAVGLAGIVSGLGLAFATGHGYLISSKPAWNTVKLPLAYTGTALAAGGFLYLVIAALSGEARELAVISWITGVCVLASVATLAVYLAHLGLAEARRHALTLWGGIVACGMAASVACAAAAAFLDPSSPAFIAAAAAGAAFTLAGGLSLRVLMWQTGVAFLSFFDDAQARRSAILNC